MTYELRKDYAEDNPHQLSPIKGGRYDTQLHGPPGTDIGTLDCDLEPFITEDNRPACLTHSGWMPSELHLKQLEAGGHIRLMVWQHPIPPLAVAVEAPVCDCHDEEMNWDEDMEGYVCRYVVIRARQPTIIVDGGTPQPLESLEIEGDIAGEQLRRDFSPE